MAECLISNAAVRFYFISRRLFICGYKESLISMRMKNSHYHFGDTINYWLASTTDTPRCTTHERGPACNWYNQGVNSVLIIGTLASTRKSMVGKSFNQNYSHRFSTVLEEERNNTVRSKLTDKTLLTLAVSDKVF